MLFIVCRLGCQLKFCCSALLTLQIWVEKDWSAAFILFSESMMIFLVGIARLLVRL